jgi:hypothetical protein
MSCWLSKMDNVRVIAVFWFRKYRTFGGVSSTAALNFGGPGLNINTEIKNIIEMKFSVSAKTTLKMQLKIYDNYFTPQYL